MAYFEYIIQKPDATQVSGVFVAEDESSAIDQLNQQGVVLSLKEHRGPPRRPWRALLGEREVSQRELQFFTRELAGMLRGGIPLARALDILEKTRRGTALGEALRQVRAGVASGRALHVGLEAHPDVFEPLYAAMVQIGEETGRLVPVLQKLSRYLEQRQKTLARIQGILAYPLLVVVLSLCVLVFFSAKVVPSFAAAFKSFNLQLPPLTRAVVAFSELLRGNFLEIIAGAVCLLLAGSRLLRTPAGRLWLGQLKRSTALAREFYEAAMLERLFSLWATLLGSGLAVVRSLDLLDQSFADEPLYARAIGVVRAQILRGKSIAYSLAATGMIPSLAVDSLQAGEEAGNFVEELEALAEFYKDRLDMLIGQLMIVLEPALILFVGAVVGVLMLSLFMPMIELGSLTPS